MNQNATCQQDSPSGNSSYSSFEQYPGIEEHNEGKVNLADVLHSDSSLRDECYFLITLYILNEVLNVHEVI
jgi:hypothetical protein